MCGIAGYFYKSGRQIGHSRSVVNMLELQRHRGPDDAGLRSFSLRQSTSREHSPYLAGEIDNEAEGVLGFNRLSIIDLSINGHQPMCSEDGQIILAFNGEIYNAFDFTDGLKKDGYSFRGHSDTEVILNLYLKYGFADMITRLNGMFAIVLIDLRKQTLFIARDRFGIKPIYLFETNELLAFSSEIKSFLSLPEFQPILSHDLLDEFLMFRTTINRTLFDGVECVEPGTYREYRADGDGKKYFYFDIEDCSRLTTKSSLRESMEILKTGLECSVKRQLMSDVKLGCQLSGGIDSSLVTWLAKGNTSDDALETVSIILEDARFTEEKYINWVTGKLGVVSHQFKLDARYYLDNLEKATWHFEGPLNHPNTIGIYLLSQRAKQHVTVLLSGEGADEVFGGYERFARVVQPYFWRNVLSALRRSNASVSAFVQDYMSSSARAILGASFMSPHLAEQLKEDFDCEKAMASRNQIYNTLSGERFDKQVKYEFKTYLPDLLVRQDKMSMAHSIENRVPFLDNELVQQSFMIPTDHLVASGNSGSTKMVLKKLAAQVFGEDFAMRPKQGFGIPLRSFFSDKKFQEYLRDVLLPGLHRDQMFNGGLVEKWVDQIQTIKTAELEALWIMVAFEVWRQQFKIQRSGKLQKVGQHHEVSHP